MTENDRSPENTQGTLGTFAGVFTPSILTILGIILFLRLGYVVGQAGLWQALVILAIANGISILTTISLSAIATNMKVKGGGDYYLISRTLGLEFGGAIGIVLFAAQSVSIGFYCIGLGEVIAGLLPQPTHQGMAQVIAAGALLFLFVFAWLGADWATKLQFLVMTILVAALVSFFVGGALKWDSAQLIHNWSRPDSGPGFWILFAIFFPAVTGFTQGVSMSGDLKDPGKSLPTGTFLAVGVSILVYFVSAVVLAAASSREILTSDYNSMNYVAVIDVMITAGVIAATLSSAMASFLGAPRILQSLAGDRIFPFLLAFAKGHGASNNPRRGILLAGGIGMLTIAMGNLNLIAPVVSMFFLISYGLLNYATYFESRSGSPSFRPRFRFYDKRISLVGFLFCTGVILAIDLLSGLVAISVLFAIYQYLMRTAGPSRWADSRRSHHIQQVHDHLLEAAREPEHPRDWRPFLLVFSQNRTRRKRILTFASWIKGQSGFATAVDVLEGWGAKMVKRKSEAETALCEDIAESGSNAFPLVITTPSLNLGLHTMLQSFGIGPLKANTILMNWITTGNEATTPMIKSQYGRSLRTAFRLGCNLMILNTKQELWDALPSIAPGKRRIDVWWWGDASSSLMLLLAYLITMNREWADAKIRVLDASYDMASDKTVSDLKQTLDDIRIDAEPEIIARPSLEAIVSHSSDATLIFLPFRLKGEQVLDPFGNPLSEIIDRLPMICLVLAAQDIDLDAEPEDGTASRIAAALDELESARKRAGLTEKDARQSSRLAENKKQELEKTLTMQVDTKTVAKIKSEAEEAARQAEKDSRRAVKAAAKLENAQKEAESLNALPKDPPDKE